MCESHIPTSSGGSPSTVVESPPAPRKSIKFQEHVVQIHTPEPLAMQKHMPHLENHQLNGILRTHHQEDANAIEPLQDEEIKCALLREIESRIEEKPNVQRDREPIDSPEVDSLKPETEIKSKSEETAKEESFLSLNGILQRLSLDTDKVQMLGSKTEQLVQRVAPSEAKRDELKEILKRNAQKLKGAFN